MSEARLVEIESKLAHQEHLVLELNDVVTRQQVQIDQLGERCEALLARLHEIGEMLPEMGGGDERPPHY